MNVDMKASIDLIIFLVAFSGITIYSCSSPAFSSHIPSPAYPVNISSLSRGSLLGIRSSSSNEYLPSSRSNRDVTSSPCPKDWKYYKKHCYRAFLQQEESLQWFEAEAKCNNAGRGRDGHLVSILDEHEMKMIHHWIRNDWNASINDAIYIGLIDTSKEGVYRWSDNNPMSYTDWAPPSINLNSAAQPDGGAFEDCTVMILDQLNSTDNWHDVPCTLGKHGTLKNTLHHQKYNLTGSFYQYIDIIDSYICKMDASIVKPTRASNRSTTTSSSIANHSSHPIRNFSLGNFPMSSEPLFNDFLFHQSMNKDLLRKLESSNFRRQFKCANGEVISIVFRCDGITNCRDGSDEDNCLSEDGSCLEYQFKCANSRCIAISAYCDFVDDCGDGSDERFCDRRMCKLSSEFKCLNGQCIAANKRCDLLTDCKDASDELACTSGSFCNPNTTFQCYYGNCIPIYAVCDKHRDCPGKFFEDEQASRCDGKLAPKSFLSLKTPTFFLDSAPMPSNYSTTKVVTTTPESVKSDETALSINDFIKCQSGQIIDSSFKCIFDFDQYGYQIGCRDVSHLRGCEDFHCPHPEYVKCPDSYCIPPRFICDGKWDCIGGADEKGCAKYYCPGQYKCANSSSCTLLTHLCDGVRHCQQGDDEWFCDLPCPENCQCNGLHVSCKGLSMTKLPDGISKKVKKLDMSFNLLGLEMFSLSAVNDVGFVYEELGELILQYNRISILRARKFIRLKNLYKLDLTHNNIKIIKSSAFAGLRRVTQLLLDYNQDLEVIEPEAFVGLTALLHLNISQGKIKTLAVDTFRGLTKLQSIEFVNNGLRVISPGAFRGLEALDSLDLSGNSIQDFPRDMFQGLKQLRHLSTDSFKFCCLASAQIPFDRCLPPADEISDCEDLMSSPLQRSFLWILGSVAIICNLLVIVKRLRLSFQSKDNFRFRDNVSSTLIISLGCADFLMGIYLLIIASVDVYYRGHYIEVSDTWRSSYLCKFCGFLSTLSTEASVFTLVFITIDRVICICLSQKSQVNLKFTMKTTYRLIILTWVAAFVMSFLPLVVKPYFNDQFYARSGVCLALHLTNAHPAGWEYSVAIFLVTNCIAFLIILIAYTCMYKKVVSARRLSRIMARHQREINTGKKMAMIVMSNFFCWFPVIIMGIIAMCGVTLPAAVYSWTAVFVLPFNSALNPILYTIAHYKLTEFFTNARRDSITGKALSMRNMTISNSRTGKTSKQDLLKPLNPPPGYVPLNQFLKETRPLEARHLMQISCFLSEQVEKIHSEGYALGGINIHNVFVTTSVDPRFIRVYVPEHQSYKVAPSRDCNDYAEDVLDIGKIIQSMLRVYNNQNTPAYNSSTGMTPNNTTTSDQPANHAPTSTDKSVTPTRPRLLSSSNCNSKNNINR